MKISKEKLNSMTKEQKIAFLEAVKEKKRRLKKQKPSYVPHEGQLEIHQCEARNRFVFAANGCWAKDTEIRMLDGTTKKVQHIKYGDLLLGPDGYGRKVVKLYKGQEKMYQINPSQSDPYIVNGRHRLSLYQRANGKGKHLNYVELTVEEYLKKSAWYRNRCFVWRPKDGIEYDVKELEIDPYVLGSWLGDGTSAKPAITTMDKEILEAVKKEYPGYKIRITDGDKKAPTYHFSNKYDNRFKKALKELDVLNNKHIPQKYKTSSKKQRYQLLAGFIDTDGHLEKKGLYYEIIQKNFRLCEDVKEIAQSLGYRVTTRTKHIQGNPYCRILIAGDIHKIPCRLKHKKASALISKQREYWREQFTVEPLKKDTYYGFKVQGIDNLVLLKDYQVQHNSGKTCLEVHEAVEAARGFNPWLDKYTHVPAKVVVVLDRPDKVNDVWIAEAKKWYDTSDWTFEKQGKPYITKITLPNGSTINFMFALMDPLAFESIELDFCVIDEPVPRKIWVALQRGGRTKGREAKFLFIGTPISAAWLRTDVYEPWTRGELPDVQCFRFGTYLNEKNLQEGFIDKFSAHLTEKEKQVRLHGEFFDTDGLALAEHFKRNTHIIGIETFGRLFDKNLDPCVLAIDPHSSKPHHACLLGVNRDNQYFYIKELKEKLVPKQFAERIKEFIKGYKVIDIVWDSSGEAEGTGGDGYKSFSQVMKDSGISGRPTSFKDKSDEDFVTRIKTVLSIPKTPDNFGRRLPRLLIVEGNPGIISDIENVGWQKYRDIDATKPKLEIRERDYLAALKYALASGLNPKSGRQKPVNRAKNSNLYGLGNKRRKSLWYNNRRK